MDIKSVSLEKIYKAKNRLKAVATKTPLMYSETLSNKLNANIWLKREDLQVVRSYKIRGAYNMMAQLSDEQKEKGIVCASAGNHAQGVALACKKLKIKGKIFMPVTTPLQKRTKVKLFGDNYVDVELVGDTYDEAYEASINYMNQFQSNFIHPFNDINGIIGQATVGMEILDEMTEPIDYLFLPIGGGGLAAGVSSYFKQLSSNTKIIGVEPEGAPSMKVSIDKGINTELDKINPFVDGASVAKVGDLCFKICKDTLDNIVTVPEGKICTTILDLYNEDAIVAEPAGALSISSLDFYKEEIKGKNVVAILSGGNNDITRMEEIKEKSMLYEGIKHYFIINFPQRAGALKEFLNDILGAEDDITYFEYTKKLNAPSGPAIVGIVAHSQESIALIRTKMRDKQFDFQDINQQPDLYRLLIK